MKAYHIKKYYSECKDPSFYFLPKKMKVSSSVLNTILLVSDTTQNLTSATLTLKFGESSA